MTVPINQVRLATRLRVRLEKYLAMARNLPQGEIDARTSFKLEVILPNVGRAIERLNAGQYGSCVDCEEPISEPRLLAVPAALRCLDCQNDLEENRARSL